MPRDPDELFSPIVIGGVEFPLCVVLDALKVAGYRAFPTHRFQYFDRTVDLLRVDDRPPDCKKALIERVAGEIGVDALRYGAIVTNEVGPARLSASDFVPPPARLPIHPDPSPRHYLTLSAMVVMPSPIEKDRPND